MLSIKSANTLKCINSLKLVSSCRHFHGPTKDDEFVKEAQYPEIPKFKSDNEKEFESLKEQIKKLKTVEEKQIYLNKPKYYGWYSCVMNPNNVQPSSLEFLQYVTNTTIIDNDLPESLKALDDIASSEAEILAPIVKNHLILQSIEEKGFEVGNDRAKFQEFGAKYEDKANHIRKHIDFQVLIVNPGIMAMLFRVPPIQAKNLSS